MGRCGALPLVVRDAVPNLRLYDATPGRLDVLARTVKRAAASATHLVPPEVVDAALVRASSVDHDFASCIDMDRALLPTGDHGLAPGVHVEAPLVIAGQHERGAPVEPQTALMSGRELNSGTLHVNRPLMSTR